MALELLGSRLLAPVFGSSIFVWGSLIGVILTALALGYYLGGKLADIRPDFQSLSLMLLVAGILLLTLPALALWWFNLTNGITLDTVYGPLLSTSLLLGPPSILLGTVSPYAIRLAARNVAKLGKAAGNLYAISTAGSIFGTFFTVFVLIPNFGVNAILLAVGVTLMLAAVLGLKLRFKVLVVLALILVSVSGPYLAGRPFTSATASLLFSSIVYETDTPYHHIIVVDSPSPTHQSTVRTLIMDNLLQSAMDLTNPDRQVFAYTSYFNICPLIQPKMTKVLFIGGGGFTGPKAFLKQYPNVTVDVVEIDPVVVRVAETYFAVNSSNPRLHIFVQDGRVFLQTTPERYDAIILDAYSKDYVPFHIMTQEFFTLAASHLNGCLLSNLVASINGSASALLTAEVNTIRTAFPNVYTFTEYPQSSSIQNVIVVATTSAIALSPSAFGSYTNSFFSIPPNHSPILTDNYAPVEALQNPITGLPLSEAGNRTPPSRPSAVLLLVIAIAVIVVAATVIKLRPPIHPNKHL